MSAFADARYIACGPICLWYKAIHQGGFSDTGMAEEHRHLVGQQRGDDVEWVVAARGGDREVEVGELLGERLRRGEIGLGQTQDRLEPACVGGDQCALELAGARWRVGQSDHDEELVGVGDDDAFGGIGVIGGAPQHRSPLTAPDDAGQCVCLSRKVTDDADVIADDDRGAPQFAGAHRGDEVVGVTAHGTAPAPAVDGDNHGALCVGVFGASLGSRPRAPAGPHPDI
jgi:hypothetical protein